jgi:predicted phage terminase large subunit-like protein
MSTREQKIKPHEFREQIAEIAKAFRQKIELEVKAFAADEDARQKRIKKVMHPVTGYRFFAETYFPHYLIKEASKLHELLYADLPVMVTDEKGIKKLIIAPRGSAKSTHVSLIFPLWCIITGQKHYIALIMDAFEQAAVMIEAFKAELEVNPRLAYDFPDMVGQGRTWREGDIITKSNVKVEGFGTGKKIRGRRHGPFRPDLTIMDDIENDENVASPKQRDKLEKWISRAVLKLGPTDGSMDVIYAGTVLHFDAVIVRFSKKPGWQEVKFQAVIKWPDRMDLWDQWEEVYLNMGEEGAAEFYGYQKPDMDAGCILNWPANHTLEFLMIERAGDHSSFESEYQNKPISDDNPFQKITWWVKINRNWVYFGAIDPSLGKKNKNRDPSAILVGAYDRDNQILDVVEASIRRRTPDIIIDNAIQFQREYQCQLWFVEAVQFQEMLRTELMKEALRQNVALPAYPVTPFTDKDLRIERLQPPIKAGLIRLHASQQTLIDQLQQWPAADHDDGPDCLEMLWTHTVQFAGSIITTGQIKSAQQQGGVMKDYRL